MNQMLITPLEQWNIVHIMNLLSQCLDIVILPKLTFPIADLTTQQDDVTQTAELKQLVVKESWFKSVSRK